MLLWLWSMPVLHNRHVLELHICNSSVGQNGRVEP